MYTELHLFVYFTLAWSLALKLQNKISFFFYFFLIKDFGFKVRILKSPRISRYCMKKNAPYASMPHQKEFPRSNKNDYKHLF